MRIALFLFISLCSSLSVAQHYRGLSVVNDNVVWMGGTKGTILRTTNSGASWDTLNPTGYSQKDFRDIHAWDEKHAVVMSAGDSSVLLETYDRGKSWKIIYHDYTPGSFFDAIDVQGSKIILVGDGISDNNPYLVYFNKKITPFTFSTHYSNNREVFWHMATLKEKKRDSFSFFAGSGANVQWVAKNTFIAIPVTADTAYFFQGKITHKNPAKHANPSDSPMYLVFTAFRTLPFKSQKAGGAYAVFQNNKGGIMAVGGSFYKPNDGDSAACFSNNYGQTWACSPNSVTGYRSGVVYHHHLKIWVCTGSNGTDYSYNNGLSWNRSTLAGYNVCAASKKYLWLAGNKSQWTKVSWSTFKSQ
ncbi:MAG: hypothetical protein IT244_05025 [Bacteroidia bacterium]|nr:hypothetical protein [Bacteroidia bacterium]